MCYTDDKLMQKNTTLTNPASLLQLVTLRGTTYYYKFNFT